MGDKGLQPVCSAQDSGQGTSLLAGGGELQVVVRRPHPSHPRQSCSKDRRMQSLAPRERVRSEGRRPRRTQLSRPEFLTN